MLCLLPHVGFGVTFGVVKDPAAQAALDCSVLLASADTKAARELAELLRRASVEVVRANTTAEALSELEGGAFDMVIASQTEEARDDGLLDRLGAICPEVPLLSFSSGDARTKVPVAAAAFGAIESPFDPVTTLEAVRRALAVSRYAQRLPPVAPLPALNEVPVRSAAMLGAISILQRVAPGNATVMIRGESGTGKEVVARRLHALSPRAAGPLVKVHCAALPEQILESELFGYERGAFTGAHARKPGRVELAEHGTLFLDEIGEISPVVQVKLLRLLQDREYERLGGTRTLSADVRFVTATHRNLERMVEAGTFREDLYYRLNVVRVDLPPLRQRREDIGALAQHFCREVAEGAGKEVSISTSALARIVNSEWRGNVRELQNFIERLVVLSDGATIDEHAVVAEQRRTLGVASDVETRAESSVISLDVALRRAELHALEKALRKARGNRTLAARILGVSRRALFYKLREHGIT